MRDLRLCICLRALVNFVQIQLLEVSETTSVRYRISPLVRGNAIEISLEAHVFARHELPFL
jgi:hypothetical protein